MKHWIPALALFIIAASIAPAATIIKLNFPQVQDLTKALVSLDGSTRLDKDNAAVQIAYDFKGKTRLAIAKDIKALSDAEASFVAAWKAYLKGAGITDESKETDAQKAKVVELLSTPTDVEVTLLDPDELVGKDSNPIPPSVLTRLDPILKK